MTDSIGMHILISSFPSASATPAATFRKRVARPESTDIKPRKPAESAKLGSSKETAISDDRTKKGRQERSRINLSKDYEVRRIGSGA